MEEDLLQGVAVLLHLAVGGATADPLLIVVLAGILLAAETHPMVDVRHMPMGKSSFLFLVLGFLNLHDSTSAFSM